jgi:hypothetical protein
MKLSIINEDSRPPLNKMFNELKSLLEPYDWYTPTKLLRWRWSDQEIKELYDIVYSFVQKYAPGINLEIDLDEFTTGYYDKGDYLKGEDIIGMKVSDFESIDHNFTEILVHELYHALNRRRSKNKNDAGTYYNHDPEEIAARGWSAYKQLSFKLNDREIMHGLRNPKSLKGKSELFDQYIEDKKLLKPFLRSIYKALVSD